MTNEDLFKQGLALEGIETVEAHRDALAAYHKVIAAGDEDLSARAHINAGTLYYQVCNHGQAEFHYRAALAIYPTYPLAMFDLANVCDETGRTEEAIDLYRRAISRDPLYADAHYNLALCYEKTKRPLRALEHWRAYVRIDTTGPWSVHARVQISRHTRESGFTIVQGGEPRKHNHIVRNHGLFVVGNKPPVPPTQPDLFPPDDAA